MTHLQDSPAIAKKLVSTEVAPTAWSVVTDLGDGTRNTASQIVQGEHATFEYSATIPAHTTVKGAVLSDGGALALAPLRRRIRDLARAGVDAGSFRGDMPAELLAFLIGTNVGPLVTPWASLATLLWFERCRTAGVKVPLARFVGTGLVLAVTGTAAATAALVLSG